MEQLLGAHTSIQGGVASSILLAEKLGFSAIQIFTKNNNRWKGKPITEEEASLFKTRLNKSRIKFVVSHDSYLINLCAADEENLKKSKEAFKEEIDNCEKLGIRHLNFHPGSHGGKGEDFGIKLITESLNEIHSLTKYSNVSSMLETTAGQGTAIGYSFEHLRKIIDLIEDKERMSVCIDTAHVFAAGYDIRNEKSYDSVIKDFDNIIGLEKLQCFHLNDSKKPCGSRVDRHDHIGNGFIGLEGFSNIMNDDRLKHIPKILETPKGKDQLEDLENLKILIGLIKQ
jgi:deoxyribonuclease-4